ncbi:hypothetical protein FHX77_001112 [Bifidobacterium commune]|uniref:Uncharacterized protein n=1 Tax=Bifidobacterium commune TaxID=1505727 RepID=A0A1C4H5H3_9BIFI|nr:hypothetical protein [Bifidobacterium commune]MBB2955686.1 hypothetical protein [Bifidobacterium commune]SCC80041.1 hypothetical protein GA0061077_0953 [Bifidobacterium commune]
MTSINSKQNKSNARPTRHATIMRGVVAPIFGLLAVLFITLGALNATIWKPSREVSASTEFSGTRYVVTDPGVLNLLANSTMVTVKNETPKGKASSQSDPDADAQPKAQMCVALGGAKDAVGWLAGQKYTRVTGLNGLKALSGKDATGPKLVTAKDSDVVAFKDSDMWTRVRCGDSSVSLSLNDVKSNQVMIVDMGEDVSAKASGTKSAQPKVDVQMRWVRDHVPNNALPFFVAAGFCVVMTILSASVFAMMTNESFKRKREQRRKMREEAKAEEVSISEAMTGSINVLRKNLPYRGRNYRPSHKRQLSDGVDGKTDGTTGTPGDASMASAAAGEDKSTPSIIDPTRRNLVADMQMQSDGNDEDGSDGGADNHGSDDLSGFAPMRGKTGKSSGSENGPNFQSPTADSHDDGSGSAESSTDGPANENSVSDALRDYLSRLSFEISGAQSTPSGESDSADGTKRADEESAENKQVDQMDDRGNEKAESREDKNADAHENESADGRKGKFASRDAKRSYAGDGKSADAADGKPDARDDNNANSRGSEKSPAGEAKKSPANGAKQSSVGKGKDADGPKDGESAARDGKRPATSGDKDTHGRKYGKSAARDGKQSIAAADRKAQEHKGEKLPTRGDRQSAAVGNKKPEARKNEVATSRKGKGSDTHTKKTDGRESKQSDVRDDKKVTGKKDGDGRSGKASGAIGKKPATTKGGEKKA